MKSNLYETMSKEIEQVKLLHHLKWKKQLEEIELDLQKMLQPVQVCIYLNY